MLMKRYIGTKIIHAEPDLHYDGRPGYKVVYRDDYRSWSPQAEFEDAYRECSAMTFGLALEALKKGLKVQRAGWNGKGMWLVLVPGKNGVHTTEGSAYMKAGVTHCDILPHIDMWTVNAEGRRAMLPGWLASQTDMLAEDWAIVD